ncbi:hypothetical protein NDU88_003233 [Pleurodeles waltl]|uniref:Uncharacterized protein n=1 Tax=Pleurodeles waltl TaxID=8319 RepID=A0AAV7QC76_PLEWA|nr:hypothetical protein NDU88_003233 [Pleurodeles waltl]
MEQCLRSQQGRRLVLCRTGAPEESECSTTRFPPVERAGRVSTGARKAAAESRGPVKGAKAGKGLWRRQGTMKVQ